MADGTTSVPAAPDGSNAATVPTGTFSAVKVRSLTVVGNHGVLVENDADWTPAGTPIADPVYVAPGPAKMASRTTGPSCYLGLQVVLDVSPPDAPQMPCSIGVTATWGDKFVLSTPLQGGPNTVTLESSVALSTYPQMLAGGLTVAVTNGKDAPFEDSVKGMQIALTIGTPRSPDGREAGFTTKHMGAAGARGAVAASSDLAAIYRELCHVCSGYQIHPAPPSVVPAMFGHPEYLTEGQGGALPIHQYAAAGAACQAQCRLAKALADLLGLPGTREVRVVWADPDKGGATQDDLWGSGAGLSGKTKEGPTGATWYCQLVDAPVVVGGRYRIDASANSVGMNNFEACLGVTLPDGTVLYFPGGLRGESYPGAEAVIVCFFALVWFELDPADTSNSTVIIREVVKQYQDAAGNPIGGGS